MSCALRVLSCGQKAAVPNVLTSTISMSQFGRYRLSARMLLHTWFVPKVSVLIFLCTNWQRSTSLMYIGTLVVTLTACPYLFHLDWLSQSFATAVCVWSCFLTSLRLRCRKISNNGTLSNFLCETQQICHRGICFFNRNLWGCHSI